MSPSVATNTPVDLEGMLEFVRARHRIVLVTHRTGGGPQLSPVTAGVDPAGRIVISSYPERAKVVNLRRNREASVMVLSDEWNGPWVQVDGTAEVDDMPDALDGLVEYYRCISGEHPDWDDYRAAMERDQRVLVRFEIERAGPTVEG